MLQPIESSADHDVSLVQLSKPLMMDMCSRD